MALAGGLWALLSALCFGSAGVCVRRGVQRRPHDNGMFITTLANVAAFAVLAAGAAARGGLGPWSWAGAAAFFGSGLLTTLAGRSSFYATVRRLGPSRASSFKCSSPVVTVLIAVLLLGDHLALLQVGGMAAVLAGLWVLTRDAGRRGAQPPGAGGSTATVPLRERLRLSPGVMYGIASALTFGVGYVLRKVGLIYWPSPAAGGLFATLVAMAGVTAVHARQGNLRQVAGENFRRGNGWYFGAAACTTLALISSFLAYDASQASIVAVLAGMEPIMTVLVSAAVLRREERLQPATLCAIALAFAGAAALVGG